jgi:hypothetical protein
MIMSLALYPGDQVGVAGLGHDRAGTSRRASRRARAATLVAAPVAEPSTASRHPGSDSFAHRAAELGHRIDECGLAAVSGDVRSLISMARHQGVALVAAGVLADPTQPEPARVRAFAHVVSALVATPPPLSA